MPPKSVGADVAARVLEEMYEETTPEADEEGAKVGEAVEQEVYKQAQDHSDEKR